LRNFKSPSERYKERFYCQPYRYTREYNRKLRIPKNYPYKGFTREIKDKVLNRDNYTCQNCGHYGLKSYEVEQTQCSKCFPSFHPNRYWSPPRFCPRRKPELILPFDKSNRIIPFYCGVCKFFKIVEIEKREYVSSLVVHHINHITWDNRLDNLMTLCLSCHNLKKYKFKQEVSI